MSKMEEKLFSPLLFPILLSLIHLSTSQSQNRCSNPSAVRAGFWFPSSNRYSSLSNITSSLYTHLYYYSLSLDVNTLKIALPTQDQLPLLTNFSSVLKSGNPSLKTLISIATDDHQTNSSNTAFSTMAADPNLLSVFIDSTIELASSQGFDGLDLAWQFPSSPSDMANLAILLATWRTRVNDLAQKSASSPPLLLTATVYFSGHLFDGPTDNLDYPIDAISANLDWINALCFGYHKSGELVTVADSPLYDKTSHYSTSYGIQSWLDAGISPCKLVMGVPLYGRSWYLKNKEKNGLGAQVVAAGPREKLSNQTGLMAYFEIKEILMENTSSLTYDDKTVSSYVHNGGLWVSFDSPEVVNEKIKFSLINGLLGYFLWPISFDDLNQTISKQAFNTWQSYNVSEEGKFRNIEAPSPSGTNPTDLAPNHSAKLSRNLERSSLIILLFNVLLFLLFNLATI